MSENWEFALNHVDKGWVTFLGDDDAILPGALKIASQIIAQTNTLAIRSNGCSYTWPSLAESKYGVIDVSIERGFETRNSKQMLQRVLDGEAPYNELPMLYNGGFISIDLVVEAKKATGTFFRSMTPDVYSAVVFSLLSETYVYSHEPLSINGASIHSGGTAAFETTPKNRKYNPAEKFWHENNLPFHPDLPLMPSGRPVRSVSILVYEAYLQAIRFHQKNDVSTSHLDQLKIALRQSGAHEEEVRDWASLFTTLHNLPMPNPSRPLMRRITRSPLDRIKRLQKRLNSVKVFGSDRNPINNVYEAATVAGSIKASTPQILLPLIHYLKNSRP